MTRFFSGAGSARTGREQRLTEARLNELEARAQRVAGWSPRVRVLTGVVGSTGNQALVSGQVGIRRQSAEVTLVSTAYDPSTSPTTTSDPGIGWADLRRDGSSTGTKVLIVHDTRAALDFDLLGGDVVMLAGPVSIPVSGGGAISAYYAVWA